MSRRANRASAFLLGLVFLSAGAALGRRTAFADEPGPEEAPAPEARPATRCDQILLDNGQTIDGWIVSEDARRIVLSLVSKTGGTGRMEIPRQMIREIRRGLDRAAPLQEGTIRDAWYLLRSGSRTVGVRRSVLRRVRPGDATSWRIEERLVWFGRGPRAPMTRIDRIELVDMAFLPLSLEFHEVGEASSEPGGPARYERHAIGKVENGTWTARVATGAEATEVAFEVPPRTRSRLAAREDLMRRRNAGLEPVTFLDPALRSLASARAGYTVVDQPDGQGGRYDEFVWEEGEQRLVTRSNPDGTVSEEVAEGVVGQPVTEAQAKAAIAQATDEPTASDRPSEVALPEAGIAFAVPNPAWHVDRTTASATDVGPRVLARMSNPVLMADVRVETDSDGVLAAPRAEEAEARILQRLRTVCPDLAVVDARAPVPSLAGGWRIGLRGTLRGESVRTIAVVVDRAPARVLVLLACPDVAWGDAREALERIVASIRTL